MRITLFDFLGTFKTIQLLLLKKKMLLEISVNTSTISWLPDRLAVVHDTGKWSVWYCGAVVSPFLVTLYNLRLSIQLWVMPHTEILSLVSGSLIYRALWTIFWSGLKGIICFWMWRRPERWWSISERNRTATQPLSTLRQDVDEMGIRINIRLNGKSNTVQ